MIFRIDLKIFIFLILYYFTSQIELYSVILIFCVIHELGHFLAGILMGMSPEKLEIMPFGLSVSFKTKIDDYNKKIGKTNLLEIKQIFVALAGPLINLLVILIVAFLKIDTSIKQLILYSNILILLFNLLPIYPLDGGRILKGILSIILGKKNSKRIVNETAIISTIVLTAIASIAIYLLENISIFLIVMYIWIIVIREDKKYKFNCKIYEMIK